MRPVSKYAALLFTTALSLAVTACEVDRTAPPAPVTQLGTRVDSLAGSIMTQPGDTVWKIAQRYNLPLRGIIDANHLQPPYTLAANQRLLLPMPVEHKVGKQDTVYTLARMYHVPSSQLVKTNNLKAPYRLSVGQMLRIPTMQGAMAEESQVAQQITRPPEERTASAPQQPETVFGAPSSSSSSSEKIETESLAPPPSAGAPLAGVKTSAPPQSLAARAQKAIQPPQPTENIETTVASSAMPNFIWPVRGKIISSYGPKDNQLYNDGINIAAPKGTPVAAAADGVVAYVGNDLASYGNLILIRHGGGIITAYAHLNNISVKRGAVVRKGQLIGAVGSTGTVANSQLHFEVRRGTETLDPQKYLG